MCDRSSDPTEHDAARERPSALDVERLAETIEQALDRLVEEYGDGYLAEITRPHLAEWTASAVLDAVRPTEPDAGEGTERHPHWRSPEYHDWHRNRGIQYTGYCRVCAPTPDTMEATLRAALIGLAFERRSRGELCWCGQTGVERHFPECLAARAALQQPAVQSEGGPE